VHEGNDAAERHVIQPVDEPAGRRGHSRGGEGVNESGEGVLVDAEARLGVRPLRDELGALVQRAKSLDRSRPKALAKGGYSSTKGHTEDLRFLCQFDHDLAEGGGVSLAWEREERQTLGNADRGQDRPKGTQMVKTQLAR
jgi:hypothetical protein